MLKEGAFPAGLLDVLNTNFQNICAFG